jgi:hypothetical protein
MRSIDANSLSDATFAKPAEGGNDQSINPLLAIAR